MMNTIYTIYARYSTDLQNPKSTEDQIQEITEDINKKFPAWKPYHRHFEDKAKRGGSVQDREAFLEMISVATKPDTPFDCIVVEDISRFARNKVESARYRELLKGSGIKVLSMADNYIDEDTEAGLWITGIKEIKAEADSREIARRTLRGLKAKARQGFSTGRKPNYGYRRRVIYSEDKDSDGNPIEAGVKLEPNPSEAKVVRLAFHLFAYNGQGLKKITYCLNEKGYRTRSGERFGSSAIRAILRNEVYLGTMIYNKTKEVRVNGHRLKALNPKDDWVVVKDAHEPLIEQETWDKAQRIIGEREEIGLKYRNSTEVHKPAYTRYLLTGLIKCADCAHNFFVRLSAPIRYYVCGGRSNKGTDFCENMTSFRVENLDSLVLNMIDEKVLDEEGIDFLVKETKRWIDRFIDRLSRSNKSLIDEKADLDSRLHRLTEAIERGIDIEEVREKARTYQTRRNEISSQLSLLQVLTEEKKRKFDFGMIRQRIKSSREILNSRTMPAMREEVRKHIASITVDKTGKGVVQTRRFGLFDGKEFFACFDYRGGGI